MAKGKKSSGGKKESQGQASSSSLSKKAPDTNKNGVRQSSKKKSIPKQSNSNTGQFSNRSQQQVKSQNQQTKFRTKTSSSSSFGIVFISILCVSLTVAGIGIYMSEDAQIMAGQVYQDHVEPLAVKVRELIKSFSETKESKDSRSTIPNQEEQKLKEKTEKQDQERRENERKEERERAQREREELERKEQERRAKEEHEKKVREEAERKLKQEKERKAEEERKRKEKDEAERKEKERKEEEERKRKMKEDAERKAEEERKEKQSKEEEERKRKEKEEAERKEKERKEEEERKTKEKMEAERKVKERKEEEERKRKEKEEAQRKEKEKKVEEERKRKVKEEAERKEQEKKAEEDKKRKEKEDAEVKAEQERKEKERKRKEKEEAEKKTEQEKKEKKMNETGDRNRREQEESDRKAEMERQEKKRQAEEEKKRKEREENEKKVEQEKKEGVEKKETEEAKKQTLEEKKVKEQKKENADEPYEFTSITNANDFKVKDDLDEADRLYEEEDFEGAIRMYDSILKRSHLSPRAMYGKGLTLDKLGFKHMSNEYLEQAINFLNRLLLLPDVPDELYMMAGRKLAERQHFRGWGGKAVKTFTLMLERFPEDVKLRCEFGVSYMLVGRNDQAQDVFEQVLQLDPNSGFAKAHLGFIFKIRDNNLEKAIPLLRDGIASGEEGTVDGRFYVQLGDALLRLGQESEARHYFKEAEDKGLFLSQWQRSLYNVKELTGRPFWTPKQLGYEQYIQLLEKNWETIRDEGMAQMDEKAGSFIPEEENLRDTGEWKQFTLYQQGRKNEENCAKVPKTCAILDQIPPAKGCKRGQIKFSVMSPGIHVWPHTGPTNCRLRSHLGLVIPDGPLLRVINETRTWQEGKVMTFDDSFEHEVWHKGSTWRLILIVDFWHPELTERQRRTLSPI